MARWWLVLLGFAACERAQTYDLRGTVVEVRPPDHVVIEHDAIPGFMDAMTMPFGVADAALVAHVDPPPADGLPEPIAVGHAFPQTTVALSGSESPVHSAPQPRALLAWVLLATHGVVRLRADDDTMDATRVRAALMEAR